jgi:uncharacterized tellurite resistance protein B-like protein
MINRVKKLFSNKHAKAGRAPKIDKRLAAAALLVEAARADRDWDGRETAVMQRQLSERFGLNQAEVEALLTAAATIQDDSNDLYRFTHVLHQAFDGPQRIELIEMLWEVVYADTHLDAFEDRLLRHVCALLYINDRERIEARRRVRARLGLAAAN